MCSKPGWRIRASPDGFAVIRAQCSTRRLPSKRPDRATDWEACKRPPHTAAVRARLRYSDTDAPHSSSARPMRCGFAAPSWQSRPWRGGEVFARHWPSSAVRRSSRADDLGAVDVRLRSFNAGPHDGGSWTSGPIASGATVYAAVIILRGRRSGESHSLWRSHARRPSPAEWRADAVRGAVLAESIRPMAATRRNRSDLPGVFTWILLVADRSLWTGTRDHNFVRRSFQSRLLAIFVSSRNSMAAPRVNRSAERRRLGRLATGTCGRARTARCAGVQRAVPLRRSRRPRVGLRQCAVPCPGVVRCPR